MDFFTAAAQTTQLVTQTMVSHFATDKDSLATVRQEFAAAVPVKEMAAMGTRAFLDKHVTFEACQDFEYLQMVINEALRFNPPAPTSSPMHVTEDTKLGNFKFKEGHKLAVNITSIHHNPVEWPNPGKFLPRRFDP